ncbi:trypsin-like peptidase domain-containing protein [Pseudomonas citronellolis]|uniref:trypsin-like peptidase domain-containing protein n=1 Tax=Pseudomonas citronellolis TaxID=53408 RepID=UPI0023E4570D|nr:trypsin-like peptidase domain-containing protein [Pseudomonas citronellolis]MDF3931848.1 trypsin-like peptidase domain-containing protein [Pseudomonas citronellolis]
MKGKLACLLCSVLLSGCNGWVKPETDGALTSRYFTVTSGLPAPGLVVASAIQWNADYAVTAAHVPYLSSLAYSCSTRCDLVFIRHKASGALPNWRPARVGEAVTALGASSFLIPTSSEGRVWPVPYRNLNEPSQELYGIHDAALAQGMSGGPLLAADGSVVGMNIGYQGTFWHGISHPGLKGAKRVSVFVPYAIIEREWKLFQAELARQGKDAGRPLQASNP